MNLRRLLPLALCLFLALSFFGCAAKSAASDSIYERAAAPGEYGYYEFSNEAENYDSSNSLEADRDGTLSVAANRKLIRTVRLSTETEDCQALVAKITDDAAALGGYLESSEARQGKNASASMTVRIPAERLNEFLALVEGASNVTWHSESTDDVTLQYADTESRIKALRVEQDRLTELLAQAGSVTELLEIEDRLTSVRYELESQESRLRTLDSLVDYSTVSIEITQVEVFTPQEVPGFWAQLWENFKGSLSGVWNVLTAIFAGIIVALPYLVVFLGIPGVIVWVLVARGVRRRRKKNLQARQAD